MVANQIFILNSHMTRCVMHAANFLFEESVYLIQIVVEGSCLASIEPCILLIELKKGFSEHTLLHLWLLW